ncbi:MAG: hypothetical protein DI628_07045 [Blastochloris viridis]|uniref:Uncharacterized protein n=1 Tax=Blastochloris viridis TaxID=1079 RepID=A0A6N4QZB6_BLAVI|nr:MAG: hypothetical protein DI628_07045 [Blastochloris viridis]
MKELPVFSASTLFQGKVVYIDAKTSDVWIELTTSSLKGEMVPFPATPVTAPYLPIHYHLNDTIEGTLEKVVIKNETRLRFARIERIPS